MKRGLETAGRGTRPVPALLAALLVGGLSCRLWAYRPDQVQRAYDSQEASMLVGAVVERYLEVPGDSPPQAQRSAFTPDEGW